MAAPRFEQQDFERDLTRRGGMDSRQAETIASALGGLASEMRENHEAVKGALHQLDERLRAVEADVAEIKTRLGVIEAVLQAQYPDAYRQATGGSGE